jgi:2-oxoglutarate ferredoxin oxidoreductase subunit gamma
MSKKQRHAMSKNDIRICGLGGQGVILSGMIIGKAAAIFEDRYATLVQAFGPEARGSEVAAQVMVSDAPIPYPYIRTSDIMMAFSQGAYDKFVGEMKKGATLVYEEELVLPDEKLPEGVKTFGIPGTRIAEEEMGRRIVFNMVMCGFFASVAQIIHHEAMRKAVADSVPSGTESFNLEAFNLGYEYGLGLR